jgi:signal transduction histidine kinase
MFLAGRKCEDKEIHLMTIDRMYVEFNLILTAGILAGTAAGMFIVGELIYMRNMTYIISAAVLVGAVGLSAVITLVMSVVRNLKNKTFLKRSLTAQIIAFLWKLCKRFIRYIIKILKEIKRYLSNLKKKIEVYSGRNFSGKNVAILFIGYSIILSLFAAFAMVPFALATIVVAVIVLLKRIEGFNKIKFGIEKIKNGDLVYKIEGCPDGVMGCMAEDINSIGEGLKESVESEIKSERMKSELITNVSHDLKTPLTSIINYSDLLNKMNLTPNEANDYVKIINQKANRLKNLTSDLFDISKVQSGNETVVLERLDITLLINQTLGELDANIKTSELEFKTSMPDESYIMGDGKKLSRVFENLIGNTLKYSLKNTRVYISVNTIDEETIIEIKNISSYPMEFDSEEITERFVRGDESRTTEGSGLGLAIAKSYTEACGGEFKIVVDGDLFKAILKFKTA